MQKFQSFGLGAKITSIVAVVAALFAGTTKIRANFLYPTSTETINPKTGRYDQALEFELLNTITYTDSVEIDMGDRSGQGEMSDDDIRCLFLLSPVLRLNPKAKRFKVKWRYVTSMYWEKQLTYDRILGMVTEQGGAGHDLKAPVVVATGVSDRAIHKSAQRCASYWSLKW